VERTSQKGLRWTLAVSPDIPDRLVGDAVRLKQVFDYLLDNAVKFTERGAIEVQVMLDPQSTDDETRLSIVVGDTGPGFSTDEMHQLFQGFTQADSSFARRHRGAGLGLAISSALINRLGGEFAIESQVGIGTRSLFTIPLKRQILHPECSGDGSSTIELSRQDRESEASSFRSLTILLAEDTPANQKLIESILVKRGHRVIVATNGREALEQFSNTRFDVIIMDLQMPMMDGYQATAAIRHLECQTERHIPIIALTAHSTASDREACLKAGMDAYLSKPINVAKLVKATESSVLKSVPRSGGEQWNSPSNGEPSGKTVVDRDSVMKRLGGDEELFRSFIEVFTEDSPAMMQQLRDAVAERNSSLIQRSAHSLRGLAANFNAAGVVELASKLEQAGKDGDLSEANSLMTQLNEAMEQLQETLAMYQS
jgi:CheY-like chemotaxis protein/anti-sigma regulatory factor (Ser/Thr protein kinase)